ncbi:MAG: hypothetical protein V4675_01155 [Verrucomicrobiota bacterium]
MKIVVLVNAGTGLPLRIAAGFGRRETSIWGGFIAQKIGEDDGAAGFGSLGGEVRSLIFRK